MAKKKLSETVVKRLTLPKDKKELWLSDSAIDGLCVRVRPDRKDYYLRITIEGKRHKRVIGQIELFTVDQARAEAEKLIKELKRVGDAVGGVKLVDAVNAYIDYRASDRNKPLALNTTKNYRALLSKYLAPWHERLLFEITRRDVANRYQELSKDSPHAATKTFRLLGSVMRYHKALADDGVAANLTIPTEVLNDLKQWNPTEARDGSIKLNELKAWFDAVEHESLLNEQQEVFRDYLIITLLHGRRRREVSLMRIEQVDIKAGVVSFDNTKAGREVLLPLTDYAKEIFERRIAHSKRMGSPYVFWGGGESGHTEEPRNFINRVRKRTGIHFTTHDLRRTFATIGESECSYSELKTMLSHATASDVTARHYVTLDVEQLRKPLERIQEKILRNAGRVGEPAEVLALNAKAR